VTVIAVVADAIVDRAVKAATAVVSGAGAIVARVVNVGKVATVVIVARAVSAKAGTTTAPRLSSRRRS
jgi:hypothetical protein